jgi:mRNA-degrading endonuclease toxin of MazEF toxin-antitoxin module
LTQSTIRFDPGAVVRVHITFTDGQAAKRRPVVIVTDARYHSSRADAIVVALSSKMDNVYHGDCDIVDWKAAGLPLPTKAKGVVETVDRASIDLQYGNLSNDDLGRVKDSLRLILGL